MSKTVQIPVFQYKCPTCGNHYPIMLPEGKCFCGGILYDTKAPLDTTDGLWYEEAFDTFPCVIAHEYKRLYELQQQKNNYGVLLQLKDVIEATIKFLTLSACAWGKSHSIEGREEAYEKDLAREGISLGHWKNIAGVTSQFYSDLIDTNNALPASLFTLLSQVKGWVEENNLVNWRNRRIGHGAVAFDNDPKFIAELRKVIQSVTDFYATNAAPFRSIQVLSEKTALLGASSARGLSEAKGECSIMCDGVTYSASPYIVHEDNGIYFFDEVVRRKKARLLNYPTGDFKEHRDEYATHLSDILHKHGDLLSHDVNPEFMSEEENDYLSRLSCNDEYVEPKYLTSWLQSCLTTYPKGVFLLEMERGCGKTFFSEKLNHRFQNPQYLAKDIDIRTYHFSRSQNGGVKEFINSISNEWRYAFGTSTIVGTIRLEQDKDHPDNNALLMCDFLKKWRAFTESNRSRNSVVQRRIMLVLDGLDEITDYNSEIWTYIPNSDMLPDGVYILLTGRNTQTDNVPSTYIGRVSKLNIQETKRITANAPENTALLQEYIIGKQLPSNDEGLTRDLIQLSEGKILLLSMLCNQVKLDGISSIANQDLDSITRSYLAMLETHYNENQRHIFQNVLVAMVTCGIYEALSLSELADFILMGSVKLELYDVISDLLPILTVERGMSIENDLQSDVNRYRLTNSDIISAVSTYLGENLKPAISAIASTILDEITDKEKVYTYSNGLLCFLAHVFDILESVSLTEKVLNASIVNSIATYAYAFDKDDDAPGSLIRIRGYNVLRQLVRIGKHLSHTQLSLAVDTLWMITNELDDYLKDEYLLDEYADVLDFERRLAESNNGLSKDALTAVYIKLGDIYLQQGDVAAENMYKKVLALLYPKVKKDKTFISVLAHVVGKLAHLYGGTGRYSESDKRYHEAEELYRKQGKANDELANLWVEQATLLSFRGKATQAEQMYERIRQYRLKQYGYKPQSYGPDMAYVDNELADLLRRKGEYEKAQKLFDEALSIYERLFESGKLHYELEIAMVCNNTGVMCRETHNYSKAEMLYKRALDIYMKYSKLSPSVYSSDVAMTSMNIGNLLNDMLRYNEVIPFYRTALQIWQNYYEMNHKAYAKSYSDICFNYARFIHQKEGDLVEAEKYYRIALTVIEPLYLANEAAHGFVYSSICTNYGNLLQLRYGIDYEEGIDLVLRSLKIGFALDKTHNPNISSMNVIEFKGIAKELFFQQAKYIVCDASKMTREKGWTDEVKSRLLQNKNDEFDSMWNQVDEVQAAVDIRNKWLDHQDKPLEQKKVKTSFGSLFSKISSIRIINGNEAPFVKKAVMLKSQGHYADANQIIISGIQESRVLSTGTALQWFSVLACCGDLEDAYQLTEFMSNQTDAGGAGHIRHDDYMEDLSCRRLLMVTCVEGIEGRTITDFLKTICGNPQEFKIDESDIDTPLKTGKFMPVIAATRSFNPRGFDKLLQQVSPSECIAPEPPSAFVAHCPKVLVPIKRAFRETMIFIKQHPVKAQDMYGSSLFNEAIMLKRIGQFEKSNAVYCSLVKQMNGLTTAVAVAWFKTLASAGDILDAVELAQYVITSGVRDSNLVNMVNHMLRLVCCVEGINGFKPIDYLKQISGNPSHYQITDNDIDVPYKGMVFMQIINNFRQQSESAYKSFIRTELP